jgi:general secretion pathway protein I
VFIATAILSLFLVLYLDALTRSPDRANRAKLRSVATMLARTKLIDVEADLLRDGWEEFDDEECGDFTDEVYGGYDRYEWCAAIQKIELPDSVNVESVMGRMLGGGDEPLDDEEGAASGSGSTNPMQNLLGMWMGGMGGMPGMGGMGGMGGAGSGPTADQGTSPLASLLAGFIAPFRNVVEQAIRRVTLRVFWQYRGKEESVTLVYYVTRPELVEQAIIGGFLQSAGAQGGNQGGKQGGKQGGRSK